MAWENDQQDQVESGHYIYTSCVENVEDEENYGISGEHLWY